MVPTDLEDKAETPPQKKQRSRGRLRKDRLSGESTNSSSRKLSWVDRLNQVENVELPEELRDFISAMDQKAEDLEL